jgi:hypothetical protein
MQENKRALSAAHVLNLSAVDYSTDDKGFFLNCLQKKKKQTIQF